MRVRRGGAPGPAVRSGSARHVASMAPEMVRVFACVTGQRAVLNDIERVQGKT
jgi:hypothetical protein